MLGSSAIVCAFKLFWESLRLFLIDHSFYVFIYAFVSALISFALSYRFGPVTNHKTLNLMQWFLQLIGLVLIAISSQIIEYSCIVILTVFLFKLISIKQYFSTSFQRKSKTETKLLTETEFDLQSDVETKKALEELKAYCLSSECNAWNVICKLKDPLRFARFINGENHISDNEIIVYENSESVSHSNHIISDSYNSDEEITLNNNKSNEENSDNEFID